MNKVFDRKSIANDGALKTILQCVQAFNRPIRNPELRKKVLTENRLLRLYIVNPNLRFIDCANRLSDEQMTVTGEDVRELAISLGVNWTNARMDITEKVVAMVKKLYDALNGSETVEDAVSAMSVLYMPDKENNKSVAWQRQNRILLMACFELIPQLRETPEYDMVAEYAELYSNGCMRKIRDTLLYDARNKKATEEKQQLSETEVDSLQRELYLARRELEDYKEAVETADAELGDKVAMMTRQELSTFYRQFNNEKYGYMIDAIYFYKRTVAQIRKENALDPRMDGVPALFDHLLQFLKDNRISPASAYPPNSVQHLTIEQMENYTFEPLPTRTVSPAPDEVLNVRVISSGWKYEDIVITYPVLREIASKG